MNAQGPGRKPAPWAALGRVIATWTRRARDRRALAQLTARELCDMGLQRARVEREIEKPFWRE